ncbi:unnamed protein product [Schistosoma guineensis]|nr:unnamed protein product [Schistosoma guineensis]
MHSPESQQLLGVWNQYTLSSIFKEENGKVQSYHRPVYIILETGLNNAKGGQRSRSIYTSKRQRHWILDKGRYQIPGVLTTRLEGWGLESVIIYLPPRNKKFSALKFAQII